VKRVLVITDLTRMQEGRVCIAGYTPDDICVRPILRSTGIAERWLYARRDEEPVVRPFALIEFDLLEQTSQAPHTEDWIVSDHYRERRGMLGEEERQSLLARIYDPDVTSIFGAPIKRDEGYYLDDGTGSRSLGTILARRGSLQLRYTERAEGKWDYRLLFFDASGEQYSLSATDLALRYLLDHLRTDKRYTPDKAAGVLADYFNRATVYLRIGLARGWERHPDRCYLQVTGVHTFPDYLRGKCFADFSPD
jgi:hypothetical protein